MDDQNKNLLLAIVLSSLVLIIWFVLFPPPEETAPIEGATNSAAGVDPATAVPGADADAGTATAPTEQPAAADNVARVAIDTPSLSGSLSLAGGRIDTIFLKNYRTSLERNADEVEVLAPIGTAQPYYSVFGWAPGGSLGLEDVPSPDTVWTVESGETLGPDAPVVLRWDSPSGLIFRRTVEVDEKFMFTVTQSVENTSSEPVRLAPYGLVARHGEPQDLAGFFIIHEGAIRRTDGELEEIDYADIPDLRDDPVWGASADVQEASTSGWIGFTDHFWMTILVPEQGKAFTSVVQYVPGADVYRTTARMPAVDVAPGQTASSTTQVFTGAKEWETIRNYEAGRDIEGFGPSVSYFFGFAGAPVIDGFIDAIDWGWFYFLTKPIFFALHELNALIGNMGIAIICLTLIIKALLFPL